MHVKRWRDLCTSSPTATTSLHTLIIVLSYRRSTLKYSLRGSNHRRTHAQLYISGESINTYNLSSSRPITIDFTPAVLFSSPFFFISRPLPRCFLSPSFVPLHLHSIHPVRHSSIPRYPYSISVDRHAPSWVPDMQKSHDFPQTDE